jgi:hypothetical protein
MSGDNPEINAYAQLCDAVSKNDNLHIIHFGCTHSELEDLSKKDDTNEKPVTSSPFAKEIRPVAFYYPHSKICNPQLNKSKNLGDIRVGSDEICLEFSVNDRSHGLTGFSLSQLLPKVVMNEGYQGCWAHNVGSHVVRYGSFTHAKTKIYDFDDITSDILLTYPQKGEDIDSINMDIGNTTDLQTFSKVLPQKQVIFIPSLPFNSNDPADQFPLFSCAHQDEIKISLILKADPLSLLIVAKENKDSLEIISPESKNKYARFYEGNSEIDSFPYPTALTHYSYMSQDECDGKWCNNGLNKDSKGQHVAFYVNQAVPFSSANPVKKETTSINKITTTHVVTSIAWLAEQTKCRERHIFSNYTTNPSSNFIGSISPIVQSTINTGKAVIVNKLPAIATTRIASRHSNRRAPPLPGIHFHSFGIRGNDNSTKPGFVFENGDMSLDVYESDPLVLDGTRDETADKYNIHVRVFCRIPFGFTQSAASEQERVENDKSIIVPLKTIKTVELIKN